MNWFTGTTRTKTIARELYGAVVAQARRAMLYQECGVPDTPEGRFEMIALHLSLLLARLDRMGEAGRKLAQVLGETFVTDMDDNMREMGVGDLAVPRKVKRAAAGLYERAARYRAALGEGATGDMLAEVLRADVLGGDASGTAVAGLANDVRSSATLLAGASDGDLLAGRVPGWRMEGGVAG